MNEPATSSESTLPASPSGASSASDPDGGNLLSWPLVVGVMLLVVAILAGALYFDPLDCLVGGAVIALGVAALHVGVWLDDHTGREAIGAPVVLFAAVVFFLVGVMTFVGTLELPGLPTDPDAEPEYVPGDLREPQVRIESPITRDPLLVSTARPGVSARKPCWVALRLPSASRD